MNRNSKRLARLVRLAKVLNKPELCPIQHGKDAFMTPDKARERNEACKALRKQRMGYEYERSDRFQGRRYSRHDFSRAVKPHGSKTDTREPSTPKLQARRDSQMASYAAMTGAGPS